MSDVNAFCERNSCKGCEHKNDCNQYHTDEDEAEDNEQ